MDRNKLEDYLRNRLHEHEEFIDNDALWADLALEKKKKKRFLPFWFFGMVLSLIVLGFYFIEKSEFTEASLSAENVVINTDVVQEPKITPQAKLEQATESAIKESIPSNLDHKISESTDRKLELVSSKKSQNIHSKTNLKLSDKPQRITFPEEVQKNIQIAYQISPNAIDNKLVVDKISLKSKKPIIELATMAQLKSKILKLDYSARQVELNISDFIIHEEQHNIIEPSSRKKWTIGFYAGRHTIVRSLSETLNPDTISYLHRRETTETPLEMVTAGGRLQYNFHKRFYGALGLEYQSINEKFDLSILADSTYLLEGVPILEFRDQKGVTTILEQGDVTVDGKVQKQWLNYNSHRQVNIPLTLGSEVRHKRFKFSGELSAVLAVRKRFRGKMLNNIGEVVTDPEYFDTSFSAGLRTSLGVHYLVGNSWSFSFRPNYQMHFRPFNKSAYTIRQEYQFYGFMLGAEYLLGSK